MYVCVCVYTCVYVCMYVHVCMYVYEAFVYMFYIVHTLWIK